MANANIPRGLVPYRDQTGRYYNASANLYYIPASDGNNYFIGDPVVPVGTSDGNGIPAVTLATAASTNYTLGPILGIGQEGYPQSAGTTVLQSSPIYRQANVATYVYVADDPDSLFWIQEDSVDGYIASDSVWDLASLVSGAGSTATGFSGWQLNSSTAGSGTQVRILRLLNQVDNSIGNYAKWLVRINQQSLTKTS